MVRARRPTGEAPAISLRCCGRRCRRKGASSIEKPPEKEQGLWARWKAKSKSLRKKTSERLKDAATIASQAFDEANATQHRREERRRHDDERRRREDQVLDQARAAAREASRAVERARQAIALSAYVDCGKGYPFPGAPAGCCLPRDTTRDDAFMSDSVQYMSITPRVEFSADLAEAVVAAATVLLTSERRWSSKADTFRSERSRPAATSTAKGATRPEPTGAAAAAREEAPKDGGTAREGLQRGTARHPPPARLRARTRTTAR